MKPTTINHDKKSRNPSSQVEKSVAATDDVNLVLAKVLEVFVEGLKNLSPSLPVWDSEENEDDQPSLKAHFKTFDNFNRLHKWTDPDKALRFRMTLRGTINEYIETLPSNVSENYENLKKELMSVYSQSLTEPAKIKFWSEMAWQPNKMSLRQFSALMLTVYKSLTKKTVMGNEANLILKDKFITAVATADPSFAQYIALNGWEIDSFEDFVAFCTNKYSVFRQNRPARKRSFAEVARTSSEDMNRE